MVCFFVVGWISSRILKFLSNCNKLWSGFWYKTFDILLKIAILWNSSDILFEMFRCYFRKNAFAFQSSKVEKDWCAKKRWSRMLHKIHSRGILFHAKPNLYIISTINIWKKVLTKAIWADKKYGLVSVRLACTSSKTEILNKIGI